MVDANISPAVVVRAYVWAVLKENYPDVWTESKYDGLVPIVPLGEAPELSEYSGPHIVYGYNLSNEAGNYFKGTGAFSMTVYDTNFRRLGKTLTILAEALGRDDDTATDINKFSSKTAAFHGLRFGYFGGLFMGDIEPSENEGGRQSASLTVSFEYYSEYDITTAV